MAAHVGAMQGGAYLLHNSLRCPLGANSREAQLMLAQHVLGGPFSCEVRRLEEVQYAPLCEQHLQTARTHYYPRPPYHNDPQINDCFMFSF